MTETFTLHERLQQDTLTVGNFRLCQLQLMNDSNYPWFILVPRQPGIREIFELSTKDQQQLLKESSHLAEILAKVFEADKINIAALGNMVPQLHIHHIARYQTDTAWPNPVWGFTTPQPYKTRASQELCALVIEHLQEFTPDDACLAPPRVC
jgi:diadenosine tetraphosphate (Ap4A) HIT family hydrolase